jgi:CO/xanthine dehydrogenase Mo-binding subunit
MEEYVPGRTENLHDYLIPTIGDVPPIETILSRLPTRKARSAPRAWANMC